MVKILNKYDLKFVKQFLLNIIFIQQRKYVIMQGAFDKAIKDYASNASGNTTIQVEKPVGYFGYFMAFLFFIFTVIVMIYIIIMYLRIHKKKKQEYSMENQNNEKQCTQEDAHHRKSHHPKSIPLNYHPPMFGYHPNIMHNTLPYPVYPQIPPMYSHTMVPFNPIPQVIPNSNQYHEKEEPHTYQQNIEEENEQ